MCDNADKVLAEEVLVMMREEQSVTQQILAIEEDEVYATLQRQLNEKG